MDNDHGDVLTTSGADGSNPVTLDFPSTAVCVCILNVHSSPIPSESPSTSFWHLLDYDDKSCDY